MYTTCSITVPITVMRKVTVAEAAQLLRISADSVRMRVRRGTLDHEKDENGRLLVYLDEAELERNEAQDATADMYLALLQEQIEQLRNEVTDWKEQLREEREANRENRRLLTTALERLPPALEAPEKAFSEARESPESASEKATQGSTPPDQEETPQRHSWWALVLRGLVAILFGLGALFWPGLILTVLIVFFGAYALVDGVLAVIAAFRSTDRGMRRPLLLIEGVIGILFGLVALFLPGLTALALVYIIAFWAILSGIARIAMAFMLRREIENEWSIALSGVLSVILGIVLILLPGAGLLAYTWLIGLLALALGIALIYYGFRVRGQRRSGSSRVT